MYPSLSSSNLTMAVEKEPYARLRVKKIDSMPCHEEYIVNCPYCSVVSKRVNSGKVIKDRQCCKILHIAYAVDTLAASGSLFHLFCKMITIN